MDKNIFGLKFHKLILVLVTILAFFFSLFNVLQGYSLVGKTFAGFGTGLPMIFSPVSDKNWTGFRAEMQTYDRIISVDGVEVTSSDQFEQIINTKKPNVPVEYIFQRGDKAYITKVDTMIFSRSAFLKTYFIMFLISIFFILISLFIIYNYKPQDDKIKVLLLFSILFAMSSASFHDQEFKHILVPLGYFIELFTVSSLIQLGLEINKKNISNKFFKISSYFQIIISSLLSLGLIIVSSMAKIDIYEPTYLLKTYLFLFQSFVIYLALGFLFFSILILFNYIKSPIHSLEKVQNRVILTGTILSTYPYIIFWFIPTIFGYKASLEYLVVFFSMMPVFIAYSIVRYKAFDIEVFIRKGLIYSTLSFILVLVYFSLSTVSFLLLKNILTLREDIYIAASAILATFIAGKLNDKVQEIIDKTFYRHKLDLRNLLEKFINEIVHIFDKDELLNISIKYLEKTINPMFIGFYIPDSSKTQLLLLGANDSQLPLQLSMNSSLWDNYINSNKTERFNHFFNKKAPELKDSFLLPLQKDESTIGVLVLGEKKSEIEYLFEEINFLKNFTASLSMALNSLMLKEETILLELKNTELENKAKLLNQITANLSHDLKFPLASAGHSLKKLEYKLKSSNLSKEEIIQNAKDIERSMKKIRAYIDISLDRELISLGKLKLKNEVVELKDVLEDAIFLHSDYFEKNNVVINTDLNDEDFIIWGDKIRLESIFSNLISNSVKYGATVIDLDIKKSNSDVIITFKDNGMGIDDSIKDKIFECYVRGDKNRGEGEGKERSTGLGLYISKNYIELMNGSISFESKKTLGTTFFIKLPIYLGF